MGRVRTPNPPQYAPAPLFVGRVVGAAPSHPLYEFAEVTLDAGETTLGGVTGGGRSGSDLNPGVSVTGAAFAAGDLVLVRTADGSGGLRWEVYPIPTAGREADYILNVCPEVTADGCPTGRVWITWADADGNTTCEETECAACVGEAGGGCGGATAAPLDSPTFTGNPTAPTPSTGDNDTSIATTAFVTAAVAAGMPVGTVAMWLTSTPPADWLILDGSSFSSGTYPALNTLLGGTTLPDMRGRSPMGAGTGSGLTARTLGTNYGAETHVLSTAEMPSHSHKVSASVAGASGGAVTVIGGAGDATTTSQGSGTAHANVHPVRAVNFIIKAI